MKIIDKIRFLSPSYDIYYAIEINKKGNVISNKKNYKKDIKITKILYKKIKTYISEIIKYFFLSIDLICISFIFYNDFKEKQDYWYLSFCIITILFFVYCSSRIEELLKKYIKDTNRDLADDIEMLKEKKRNEWFIIDLTLRNTKIIFGFILIMGIVYINSDIFIKKTLAYICIYYFGTRPIHYCYVFYTDFKSKIKSKNKCTSEQKSRLITLTILNYFKINIEFCILIYILKVMNLGFVTYKCDSFFNIVYNMINNEITATSNLEMTILLAKTVTLALLVTLNLATYMSMEKK